MTLYWVTTKDHNEDWFVAANSETDATAFFEKTTGYKSGDAAAEYVMEIPAELPTETGWPPDHLLLALDAEFIYDNTPRVVEINGRLYVEGNLESQSERPENAPAADKASESRNKAKLFSKAFGCILGGVIGDALGTPSEGKDFHDIEKEYGWIDGFEGTGTDDTIMKNLLAKALINTEGFAGRDDWAKEWLDDWQAIFGEKRSKFFISVHHTAIKLQLHSIPRMAAMGNMPSSSSAMAIAPVGIVNACRPRQAAQQAYNIASLIHTHDVSFCQDAAAAVAAGVAEAFKPDASVDSIIDAALRFMEPLSGRQMKELIEKAIDLAQKMDDFKKFRNAVYDQSDTFFRRIGCDARETVPLTYALFYLSKGDYKKSVTYAANFGRDTDTIACMVGGITGALVGEEGIDSNWKDKIIGYGGDEKAIADRLAQTAIKKDQAYQEGHALFGGLL